MTSQELIHAYYDAFNRQDMSQFLSYLSETVVHDINQGHREDGKLAFSAFMDRMNAHYREQIVDIEVCVNDSGNRASAEFRVLGEYLATDDELPPATGQKYDLPAGAFFEIQDGLISRVTNYYNLQDWIRQVAGNHE